MEKNCFWSLSVCQAHIDGFFLLSDLFAKAFFSQAKTFATQNVCKSKLLQKYVRWTYGLPKGKSPHHGS